jgi:hypothetical protein
MDVDTRHIRVAKVGSFGTFAKHLRTLRDGRLYHADDLQGSESSGIRRQQTPVQVMIIARRRNTLCEQCHSTLFVLAQALKALQQ